MKRIIVTAIQRNEHGEIVERKEYQYDQRENVRTLESELAFQRALAVIHEEVFPEAKAYNPMEAYYWLMNCNGDPRYMRVAINTTFIPVGPSPMLYDLITDFEIEREDSDIIIRGANFFSSLMQHLRTLSKQEESVTVSKMPNDTKQNEIQTSEIS